MSKLLKYTIISLVVIIIGVIAFVVYRMFFQFNNSEIKTYVKEASEKYKDQASAYALIMDGVEYILASNNLTQQVLKSARATGTDPEQELVNSAIAQCKAFKYI